MLVKFLPHKKGDWWNGAKITITPKPNTDPIDLTTLTDILMQVKSDKTSKKSFLEFSIENGKITVLNATQFLIAGQVVDIPAAVYHSDIQITTSNGKPLTIMDISWEISQDVSRKEAI